MIRLAVVCVSLLFGIFVIAGPDPKDNNLYLRPDAGARHSRVPIQAVLANQIPHEVRVRCVGFLGRETDAFGVPMFFLYADRSSMEAGMTMNAILLRGDGVPAEDFERNAGSAVEIDGEVQEIRAAGAVLDEPDRCAEIVATGCRPFARASR